MIGNMRQRGKRIRILHADKGMHDYDAPVAVIARCQAARLRMTRLLLHTGLPCPLEVKGMAAAALVVRETLGLASLPSRTTKASAAALVERAGAACDILPELGRGCHGTINGHASGYHYDTMGMKPEYKIVLVDGVGTSYAPDLQPSGEIQPLPQSALDIPGAGMAIMLSAPSKCGDGDIEISVNTTVAGSHATRDPAWPLSSMESATRKGVFSARQVGARGAFVRSSLRVHEAGLSFLDHEERGTVEWFQHMQTRWQLTIPACNAMLALGMNVQQWRMLTPQAQAAAANLQAQAPNVGYQPMTAGGAAGGHGVAGGGGGADPRRRSSGVASNGAAASSSSSAGGRGHSSGGQGVASSSAGSSGGDAGGQRSGVQRSRGSSGSASVRNGGGSSGSGSGGGSSGSGGVVGSSGECGSRSRPTEHDSAHAALLELDEQIEANRALLENLRDDLRDPGCTADMRQVLNHEIEHFENELQDQLAEFDAMRRANAQRECAQNASTPSDASGTVSSDRAID